MNKTAVVILNFNGRELLRQFLPSVIRFSRSATILVADNGSTDGSLEVMRREFPEVGILAIPQNLGFCGGYNFSLKQLEADYYVLLNSDVEVTEGWLDPIVMAMEADPSIAAAQPKVLSFQNKTQFEYAGAAGGFIDTLGYPFCRGRIFNSVEEDLGQYNDVRPVFWATGACMVIRARVFHEMGGLDEDFFAHMEEIDLCWKLHAFGYGVFYFGQCSVYHVGGGTLSKSNPNKTYLNFRNGLSLIFKHLDSRELIWKLVVRVVLDWCAGLSFLMSGSAKDALAVAKAHFHFFFRLSLEMRKRSEFGKQKALIRSVSQQKTIPIYRRMIVLDYYLRGRKRFRDLPF